MMAAGTEDLLRQLTAELQNFEGIDPRGRFGVVVAVPPASAEPARHFIGGPQWPKFGTGGGTCRLFGAFLA